MRRLRSFVAVVAVVAAVVAPRAHASEQSEWHTLLGMMSLGANRPEAALAEFERAVAADGDDVEALYRRGVARGQLGLWDAAVEDFEAVIERDPDRADASLDLGVALLELRRPVDALAALARARTFEETSHDAALYMGLCLFRLGQYDAAIEELQSAAASPPLTPTARYYQGVIAYDRRQYGDARGHFEYVAAERPSTEIGRQAATYLERLDRAWADRFDFRTSVAFQYDSNVGLVNGLIEDVQSSRDDGRVVFQARASALALDGESTSLSVGYDFFQSLHFELAEFDIQNHAVWAEGSHALGPVEATLFASWDYYLLDTESFLDETTVSPSLAVSAVALGDTVLRYVWRRRHFRLDPFNGSEVGEASVGSRNADIHTMGFRQHFDTLNDRWRAFVGYAYEIHDAEDGDAAAEAFAYDGHQFEAGTAVDLAEGLEATLEFRYRTEQYSDESGGFSLDGDGTPNGRRREDQEARAIVAVRKDLSDRFAVTVAYLGVDNSSDDARFEYTRHIGSLSLETKF